MQPPDRGTGRYALDRVAPYPLVRDVPYDVACHLAAQALFDDVEGFHTYIVRRYGGEAGWHDKGLLEAAVNRPFATAGGTPAYPSGLEQAAALLHSIVKNHPFLDANKRTGYYACCFFLEQCGYWRYAPFLNKMEARDLEQLVLDIARETDDLTARRLEHPYTIEQIAHRLDHILAGSRTRRESRRRARSGAFHPFGDLLDPW